MSESLTRPIDLAKSKEVDVSFQPAGEIEAVALDESFIYFTLIAGLLGPDTPIGLDATHIYWSVPKIGVVRAPR